MRHPADDGYDDAADFNHSPAVPRGNAVMSKLQTAQTDRQRGELQAKRAAVTPKPGRAAEGAPINNDNARGRRNAADKKVPLYIQYARKELAFEYARTFRNWGTNMNGPELYGSTVDVPDPTKTRTPYPQRPFRVHLKETGETIWCRSALEARITVEEHRRKVDNATSEADEKIHPFRSPLTRDALTRVFHDYKKGFTHE